MFDRDVRMSKQTIRILAVMLEGYDEDLHGRLIGKRAAVSSGTLFPSLARLESAGWIYSHEEDADPVELGRPLQRIYKLTASGETAAREEIANFAAILNRALDSPASVGPEHLTPTPRLI